MARIGFRIAAREVSGEAVRVTVKMVTSDYDVTAGGGEGVMMTRLGTNELPVILNALRHDGELMSRDRQRGFDYVFPLVFD